MPDNKTKNIDHIQPDSFHTKNYSYIYRQLTDNLHSGVLIINKDAQICYLNSAGKKILDIHHDEINGLAINQIINGLAINQIINPVDNKHKLLSISLYKKKVIHRRKVWIRTNSGRKALIGFSAIPIQDDNNFLLGIIFTDLTRDEIVKKEMIRIRDMAQLGETLAWLAHEFKNPITSIQLGISILSEHCNIPDKDIKYLDMIHDKLEKLDNSLKELIDFARPARPDHIRPHFLRKHLKRALYIMKPQLEQKGIQLEVNFNDFDQIKVLCDPDLLEQVFINLTINAIQAMPSGGFLKINVKQKKDALIRKDSMDIFHNVVDVLFIDTGIGILPENLNRIFDSFFTTKRNGTGLGLAIARKAIENAGGKILIESEPDKGSCFTVRLLSGDLIKKESNKA